PRTASARRMVVGDRGGMALPPQRPHARTLAAAAPPRKGPGEGAGGPGLEDLGRARRKRRTADRELRADPIRLDGNPVFGSVLSTEENFREPDGGLRFLDEDRGRAQLLQRFALR